MGKEQGYSHGERAGFFTWGRSRVLHMKEQGSSHGEGAGFFTWGRSRVIHTGKEQGYSHGERAGLFTRGRGGFQAQLAFLQARMYTAHQEATPDISTLLKFVDFNEALARVSDHIALPPIYLLRQIGLKGDYPTLDYYERRLALPSGVGTPDETPSMTPGETPGVTPGEGQLAEAADARVAALIRTYKEQPVEDQREFYNRLSQFVEVRHAHPSALREVRLARLLISPPPQWLSGSQWYTGVANGPTMDTTW
eukprot:976291-Pyramimonas_sp.AAC.1